MLKRSIIGLVFVALMAGLAQAGTFKIDPWVDGYGWTDWTLTIGNKLEGTWDVVMKVPFWCRLNPQNGTIEIFQCSPLTADKGLCNFIGYSSQVSVWANWPVVLTTTIDPNDTGKKLAATWISGVGTTKPVADKAEYTYDGYTTGAEKKVYLMAGCNDANLSKLTYSCTKVSVATLKVWVKPPSCLVFTVVQTCP
jgi:hypothetical protein